MLIYFFFHSEYLFTVFAFDWQVERGTDREKDQRDDIRVGTVVVNASSGETNARELQYANLKKETRNMASGNKGINRFVIAVQELHMLQGQIVSTRSEACQ